MRLQKKIAEAQANYEKWLESSPPKKIRIAQLRARIDALKGVTE